MLMIEANEMLRKNVFWLTVINVAMMRYDLLDHGRSSNGRRWRRFSRRRHWRRLRRRRFLVSSDDDFVVVSSAPIVTVSNNDVFLVSISRPLTAPRGFPFSFFASYD